MATLNLCPLVIDFCLSRGDSVAFTFTLKTGNPALAIDITGSTFLLTVDPEPNPADAVNNLFQLAGTLTNPTGGVVQFQPTPVDLDQTPGVYFHDVQWTDSSGAIRTIAAGEFEIQQDVTK